MMNGGEVDRGTKVLEFYADERKTEYAILSHRWQEGREVGYEEMVRLAETDQKEREEIRERAGYQKILQSCKQAKKDGYRWLWIDTCCIDKRSSAELSEAINSMYRWYENSTVCYAYLHDVDGSSFPTEPDTTRYPTSNGWPEWFSRGWTLQEMIAPSDVWFFNKDWKPINNKKVLGHTLARITRVPERILTDGLSSNRPCVAQIMSWAADRTTSRDEDRAYSLLGLLDVNMPMLYGEGKKAFRRLQLEIIRMSNDQSIFAWGCGRRDQRSPDDGQDWESPANNGQGPPDNGQGPPDNGQGPPDNGQDERTRSPGNGRDQRRRDQRTGSILADDPSFFRDCHEMELIDHNTFIQSLKANKELLRSIEIWSIPYYQLRHPNSAIPLSLCRF